MSKIKIKNFGPIKEGCRENEGWIDVKKVTVFIGNQGSGKSTVAKVISTLTWLEKAIKRGDVDKGKISLDVFYKFFKYQRIHNYFRKNTIIEFIGDQIMVRYLNNSNPPSIETIDNKGYLVPKIMYVPAERNFLSTVKNAYGLKNLPDTLYTFAEELRKGQLALKNKLLELPIGDLKYKYDSEKENSYLIGKDYELDLGESSSGYQSLVPLYLVSKFLTDELQKSENVLREQLSVEQSVRRNKEISDVMFDKSLSESEKTIKVEEIDSKYLNTCFINIVEEPEQNLFPTSQQQILNSLLEFNNMNEGNKLILTTHSPYIINYLSIAIQGAYMKNEILKHKKSELLDKLEQLIPQNSLVDSSNVVVYQLDEEHGVICKLPSPEGIPSDKNYLNQSIRKGNELFDSLLEIEEEL